MDVNYPIEWLLPLNCVWLKEREEEDVWGEGWLMKNTTTLKGILGVDWEDQTVWSECVGNGSKRGKAWGEAAGEGGGRGGWGVKLCSFLTLAVAVMHDDEINQLFLITYMFEKDKMCRGRKRSHTVLIWSLLVCQAAPIKTCLSQKDEKEEQFTHLTFPTWHKLHIKHLA